MTRQSLALCTKIMGKTREVNHISKTNARIKVKSDKKHNGMDYTQTSKVQV